ncbi:MULTISPECIES: SAM-dependent methyltransferase [unclassified Leptolyngbya]|uniref:class I SAM-dependent methyltransferase n=1 Tax=unclassified Leptolyngbya TaxID=2650499 RepID=UPI001681D488|nr:MULTISPECIES: SAM-dependent methyltransferase [unclassified Leptolyngbya]MBD1909072.1 SAM-dependent methyltransferase [Leptolyngbya sp. FACHB-8]MBD2157148.1 SAM-dependent methyltransferase [Leptolyngbya sp. FACHB-16]
MSIHDAGQPSPSLDASILNTAMIVAAKRAIEQQQPFPLFTDPYSQQLAGAEVSYLLEQWQAIAHRDASPLSDVILKRTRYISVRTRTFDDRLLASNCTQVVLLGAGLDTRAYRLSWHTGIRIFEVDDAELLAYKTHCLGHPSEVSHVLLPGDLRELSWVEKLHTLGFNFNKPTAWLLEGVLMYLEEAEVVRLLRAIASLSAQGSSLHSDVLSTASILASNQAQKANDGRVVQHWQWGCDHPTPFFQSCGWTVVHLQHPASINNGFGRYDHLPISQETGGNSTSRQALILQAVPAA